MLSALHGPALVLLPLWGSVYFIVGRTALYSRNPLFLESDQTESEYLNSAIYCGALIFRNWEKRNCGDNLFHELSHVR